MPSEHTRRGFLAVCGTGALGGCSAFSDPEPDDVVAGVESKSVKALRANRYRPVVQNRPHDPVEHRAPIDLALGIHEADREVLNAEGIEFPESGSLVIDDSRAGVLGEVYDELSYVLVLTLYEREAVFGVPLGNAYGYRIAREAFNRVDPGDRIVVRVEKRDDLPWIADLVDVTAI